MNETESQDDEISLIDLFAILWRRKVMIIVITLIAAIGVVVFAVISIMLPPETSPLPNEYTSMKIIDSAYNGTENSARHLFPMYIYMTLIGIIASVGTLYMFGSVRWWLLLTLVVPFVLETWLAQKYYVNIYDELAAYWEKERRYTLLGTMLKSRDYIRENRLFQMSNFLIQTYRKRLHCRNREYEKYYFKHLRTHFTGQNISRIAQIGNALILLWLYTQGALNIGLLISLTLTVFSSLFNDLMCSTHMFRYSAMHIKSFDFYDKYFALSEDTYGDTVELPADCAIEFDDVHFTYPGTDKPVLQGLTFRVASGEKVSGVGENGEGKTTMVKLLLGLFQPDTGSSFLRTARLSRTGTTMN
ncbi:hypothetical protein FACS189444_2950 [Spirochaetia bacterium]|nr:hypothetical protein FACS189444_2950 [Spirochaetia bacterium]